MDNNSDIKLNDTLMEYKIIKEIDDEKEEEISLEERRLIPGSNQRNQHLLEHQIVRRLLVS